jgi:hypothetical protein
MTDYIQISYEYLREYELLDIFIEANDTSPNYSNHSLCSESPINSCIIWADTPQGQDFWQKHDRQLSGLLAQLDPCTVEEFLEYTNNIANNPIPYEYW